jgi:hypothetical protein
VTGFTKCHKITFIVSTAFGERDNVMDFFGRCEPALLLTFLTKRVRSDVTVSNTLPGTAISFVRSRITLELVVVFVHYYLVLGTVLLTFSKPTATGISTGTLWFVRHGFTSLSGHNKSHRRFLRDGLAFFHLPYQL